MLQIFKVGTPDRLLFLLVLFGLFQIPYLLYSDHILVAELLRIRLGERLADGWRMYAQIADDTAPISAMVYGLMAKAGFANYKFLRCAGAALIWFQALWFNQMAFRYQMMSEKNFLIAFLYIVLVHCGADTISISPVLIGLSFLLFAFEKLFHILKEGVNNDDVMLCGLWLGMAVASSQPFVVFIIPVFLAAFLFTSMRLNHYFTIAAACLLPSGFVYTFFLYTGGSADYLFCFMKGFTLSPRLRLVDLSFGLSAGFILLLLAISGWFFSNQHSRINFHRVGLNVFFFSSIAALGGLFIGAVRCTENLLLLVPMASFLLAQMFILSRKQLYSELTALIIIALCITGFYQQTNPGGRLSKWNADLFVKEPPKGFMAGFGGKSILNLSDDVRFFAFNKPATRFFRHYLSNLKADDSKTYQGLIYWHQCLSEDPPALIYDPGNFASGLMRHMPEFSRCYQNSKYPGLYVAIPGRTFGQKKP
jgi:hypothetical protein